MRWLKTEYILKGVYLGLVLFAALQEAKPTATERWASLLWVNVAGLSGLVIALGVAGFTKLREGYAVKGRLPAFAFFLLLESPLLIYAGLIGGTFVGVLATFQTDMTSDLIYVLSGGALLGVAFGALRQVRHKSLRLPLIFLVSAALAAFLLLLFARPEAWPQDVKELRESFLGQAVPVDANTSVIFGVQLLLGIPFFAVLTFAGQEEESEIEIGAMCATLAVAVHMMWGDQLIARLLGYFLPLTFFFFYTLKVLPGLRVLKHTFRGYSHARVGRFGRALQSFRRALQLDPKNQLALNGFWNVHCQLDFNQVRNDAQMIALVDVNLCMEQVEKLLNNGRPTPAQLQQSRRLLELVLTVNPGLRPSADYWEAVGHIHYQEYDDAETKLNRVLDPGEYGHDNVARQMVLLQAWEVVLTRSDEMRRRVGHPQLGLPGRRMEAIAAVERQLAQVPNDQDAWTLKRVLYADLTEADYDTAFAAGVVAPHFDHAYAQELGQAHVNDDAQWQRGTEFLRLAARGLPATATGIYVQLAKAYQRHGDDAGALHYFNLARRAAQAIGIKNLSEPEQQTYFATVKFLGESALYHGNVDEAIDNFHHYAESERSGVETLRTLADLYEKKGDALNALRINDHALIYSPRDKDLLARKDRYYYSVTLEQLRTHLEVFKSGFDVDYCVRKAKGILDARYEDPEWLNVATHLIQLARVVMPANLAAKVLEARLAIRSGERDRALPLLEEVRAAKEQSANSGDEQEAWYQANQLLGDLYLETGRPDQALVCLESFRESSRSGARTRFKMGQAYEMLGDRAKALKCYEQVTAYEGNPLVYEARDAMSRMKQSV